MAGTVMTDGVSYIYIYTESADEGLTYMRSVFSKILKINTPQITHGGEM